MRAHYYDANDKITITIRSQNNTSESKQLNEKDIFIINKLFSPESKYLVFKDAKVVIRSCKSKEIQYKRKAQTMVYNTLHRKLKIAQQDSH